MLRQNESITPIAYGRDGENKKKTHASDKGSIEKCDLCDMKIFNVIH